MSSWQEMEAIHGSAALTEWIKVDGRPISIKQDILDVMETYGIQKLDEEFVKWVQDILNIIQGVE